MITTKICSKCKTEKSLDEFRNQAKGKYGKKNYCKICDDNNAKESYNKHKEYRKLQITIWNENNPDKTKEYKEKWIKSERNKDNIDLDF